MYGEGQRGIGTGGSEYALLTMCEAWHNAGHEVILYNNPRCDKSPFEQRSVHSFDPNEDRDILIVFRTPNEKALVSKGKKVFWSCDQYTSIPFRPFLPYMDKVVVISEFHKNHFRDEYGFNKGIVIDIPVRLDDLTEEVEKQPLKCMFTSVPDRGLMDLYQIWTATISKIIPEATLTITSDYRLWGVGERNTPHRLKWMYAENVTFLGAIKRRELIKEQLSAQLLIYPSNYDELFCVSVAEAQACGMYTITSDTGALPTTNMGTVIPREEPNFRSVFAHTALELLNDPELHKKQAEIKKKAWKRFSVKNILKQWDEKVFGG